MILLAGAFSIARVFFNLLLAFRWKKISYSTQQSTEGSFSIVIPVRNEAANILGVLADLEQQSFPKAKFEVLLVDDFSTDDTVKRASAFAATSELDLKLFSLTDQNTQGKKFALTLGISKAIGEVILTTDADCRLGSDWIASYASLFDVDTNFVAGPVVLSGGNLFAAMQVTEFAGLVAFGAVTLEADNPSMCSGANMGFRKQAFETVGGYESNIQLPTGDDEFLLYDILQKFPGTGKFLKSEAAIVVTQAHTTYRSFFNQRARWISKWKHNRNWKLRLLAVLFFFDYLVLLVAAVLAMMGHFTAIIFGALLLLRFVSERYFLATLLPIIKPKRLTLTVFLLQIFYPFHVLFMGVLSIFGRYTWKGRKY